MFTFHHCNHHKLNFCVNNFGQKSSCIGGLFIVILYVHSNAMVWCALFLLVNLARIVLFALTDKLLLPVLCFQWTYRTKNSWMSCITLASVLYFHCTTWSIFLEFLIVSVFMLCLVNFLYIFNQHFLSCSFSSQL